MSYVFGTIIFIYLAALCLKWTLYTLYWLFNPIYEWAYETCRLGRYPNKQISGLSLFFAKPVNFFCSIYRWCDLHFRNLWADYLIILPLMLIVFSLLLGIDDKGGIVYLIFSLLTVCIIPTFFLTCITEPLGLVHTSYLLGNLARFTYRQDHQGGSLFSACIAWQRRPAHSKRTVKQKKRLLELLDSCDSTTPAVVFCRLLLTENDENLADEQRVSMLQSFYFVNPLLTPSRMQTKAGLWLAALSAQQGNWSTGAKWSGLYLKKKPNFDLLFFYLIFRRMEYQSVVGGCPTIFLSWLFTFNFRYFAILRMGCRQEYKHIKKMQDAMDFDRIDRKTGIRLLGKLSAHPKLRQHRKTVHRLARYFEDIIVDQQQRGSEEKAKVQAIDKIEEALAYTFSSWNESASGTVDDAEQSLLVYETGNNDTGLLEDLRANLRALQNRYDNDRYLAPELEWQEWAGIMGLYEQSTSLINTRYEAYVASSSICWNWAAWLWNQRKNYPLSKAIFQWILDEALLFEDYDTVIAMEDNLR